MNIKTVAFIAILISLPNISFAIIVNVDWQSVNDNLITRDTSNGLDWLDLGVTANRSYDDISSQLGAGGEFSGWRYATRSEIISFFDSFGGDSQYYLGWTTQNNDLFSNVAPYWGDLKCDDPLVNCPTGAYGYSYFIYNEIPSTGYHTAGLISDNYTQAISIDHDYIWFDALSRQDNLYSDWVGHALVKEVTTVPVPSAIWLFGSGLIGLIGAAKRKKS